MAAIFTDPLLDKHLAMRGGTVLHKAHLAPAAPYSEDIALVLVKAMAPDTLDQHLRLVLTPVLGQPADSLIADAWLAILFARWRVPTTSTRCWAPKRGR